MLISKIFLVTSLVKYILLVGIFAPTMVFAAQISFNIATSEVRDDSSPTIIDVHLDPAGKVLNAIEGTLKLQMTKGASISSVSIETGNSLVSLWPTVPEYSKQNEVIRFAGGNPNGFNSDGLLFRVLVFTSKPGDVIISWIGGSAYLNDGKGTPEAISSRSITVALDQSTPNLINSATTDSEPPYFDMIEVGNDVDVYDGKYFVSFIASDNHSGIDHYEVVENQVVTKLNNGVYLLQDQSRKSRVIIVAYDKAGNSKSIKVPTKYEPTIYWVLAILVFVTITMFILRKSYIKIKYK